MNRRGGALLATIIISMLLLSVAFGYFRWTMNQSQENAHSQVTQRAEEYAESGVQAAEEQLMLPYEEQGLNLAPGTGDMARGRYEFELTNDSQTPTQVEIYATGYSNFPQSADEDPVTHQHARKAIVHAVLYVDRVDKMMVAVPGTLKVNPGTMATDVIYAEDLIYVKGAQNNPARVAGAAYSHSSTDDDGTTDAEPSYVVFGSTPALLGFPIRFPQLSGTVRDFYKAHATSQASQLDDGANLDGLVQAPDNPDFPVYFCDGDLHIGKNHSFTPDGLMIIYVTGILHIHDAISSGDGWAVFMAEKGIQIEKDVPHQLSLHGTFITNGAIVALPEHLVGNLIVNGSLIAGQGIDLATAWDGQRTYYHRQAFPALPLPHLVERLQSEVVQGKYK